MTLKKEMNIELDPDIAAAFNASTSVSRKFSYFSNFNININISVEGNWSEYAQGGLETEKNQEWDWRREANGSWEEGLNGSWYAGAGWSEKPSSKRWAPGGQQCWCSLADEPYGQCWLNQISWRVIDHLERRWRSAAVRSPWGFTRGYPRPSWWPPVATPGRSRPRLSFTFDYPFID